MTVAIWRSPPRYPQIDSPSPRSIFHPMGTIEKKDGVLLWSDGRETIRIEAWGRDAVRVRGTLGRKIPDDAPNALLAHPPPPAETAIEERDGKTLLRSGKLTVEVSIPADFANQEIPLSIRFLESESGRVLLSEAPSLYPRPPARRYGKIDGEGALLEIEATFSPNPGERLYGLGQHQHGLLNQKGAVIDLVQYNSEIAIPFLLSSAGYGFLWNNPALGRVELAENHTRWRANAARGLDYLVFAGDTPLDILKAYLEATGRPHPIPEWALGFWQSKLRYRNQKELLDIAREYKRRGLPLSVLVIDYFNWSKQGDWRFDPEAWPNPSEMVRELRGMGVETMVSTWPTVNPESGNFEEMSEKRLLLETKEGPRPLLAFREAGRGDERVDVYYYDSTNPEARRFLWEKIDKGYRVHGIKAFWLDACEPELSLATPDELRFHIGEGKAVANIYPLEHQRAYHEGALSAENPETPLLLCRSAWAGSQRFPVVVWSGDIPSTFEALRAQVRAGLNMALSGIPWWTTDIGGFHSGDSESPAFRELLVRWFQYAAFCPVFRLHGFRLPNDRFWDTGGPNEPWSFGDEAYGIIKDLLFLRERLRPYLAETAEECAENGTPPMRPLLLEFPNDPECLDIGDQFTLGPDILVSPVLSANTASRNLYLPEGADWVDVRSEKRLEGGRWISVDAPIDAVPVHIRAGSDNEAALSRIFRQS